MGDRIIGVGGVGLQPRDKGSPKASLFHSPAARVCAIIPGKGQEEVICAVKFWFSAEGCGVVVPLSCRSLSLPAQVHCGEARASKESLKLSKHLSARALIWNMMRTFLRNDG